MDNLAKLKEAVIAGNRQETLDLIEMLRSERVAAMEIVDRALVEGINEVGRLFERGKLYVPDMMLSAICVRDSFKLLDDELKATASKEKALAVVGTVKGDLHDIGKNLVKMLWEAAGYRVIDLGVDVHPDRFVDSVIEYQPQVLGLSALLTTTLESIEATAKALQEAGQRDMVKLAIGGAATSEAFAEQVGADGYARSGAAALEMINRWFS
jgi:5-methyltetrahydrofolate--homocysteine methyltransferase